MARSNPDLRLRSTQEDIKKLNDELPKLEEEMKRFEVKMKASVSDMAENMADSYHKGMDEILGGWSEYAANNIAIKTKPSPEYLCFAVSIKIIFEQHQIYTVRP